MSTVKWEARTVTRVSEGKTQCTCTITHLHNQLYGSSWHRGTSYNMGFLLIQVCCNCAKSLIFVGLTCTHKGLLEFGTGTLTLRVCEIAKVPMVSQSTSNVFRAKATNNTVIAAAAEAHKNDVNPGKGSFHTHNNGNVKCKHFRNSMLHPGQL